MPHSRQRRQVDPSFTLGVGLVVARASGHSWRDRAMNAESAAEQPTRGDTMTDASGFTKLVPGFEFMQSLVKNAGAALQIGRAHV